MKKFLMIFGAIALVCVVALGGMIGWAAYRGSALDKESKAYVDDAVPAITRSWNKQELLDRAAPEFKAKIAPDQLTTIFASLAQFGPMIEYQGAKGDAAMSYGTEGFNGTSAQYEAKARFQNGSAIFRIALVKKDGRWMIVGFHAEGIPPPDTTKKI